MKFTSSILSVSIVAFSLTTTSTTASAQGDKFVCDAIGDGAFTLTFSDSNGSRVLASYALDGRAPTEAPTVLLPAQSGSGFRYTGPGLEFQGKGDAGIITDTGAGITVPCRIETTSSSVSNNQSGKTLVDAFGRSLGGKVRSGPGLNFPQIASFSEGQPLTIIHNSGVRMDGYDWFEVINETNGIRGYQWGGILCARHERVTGVYQRCN